jgi:pimeloyl-ACP methyl ester carboxylesterase
MTCSKPRSRPTAVGNGGTSSTAPAITRWGIPDPSKLSRLPAITLTALVANGDNDTMMHTENSYRLAHHLPNAQLRIYPDSGHGFLDQYPTLFADHVNAFLRGRLASRSRGDARSHRSALARGRHPSVG